VDAIERRAVIELHDLVVNTNDFLPLCLFLKCRDFAGAQMLENVSQRLVICLGDENIALQSPRTRLNDLELAIVNFATVFVVRRKATLRV
jgi:hypothetical protein